MTNLGHSQNPLEELAEEHSEILEWAAFFNNHLRNRHDGASWAGIRIFRGFLEGNVVRHFRFEDREVFPFLLKRFQDARLEETIRTLIHEHRALEQEIASFCDFIGDTNKVPSHARQEAIKARGETFFQRLISHAATEEALLVPLLKLDREALKQTFQMDPLPHW